MPGRISIFWRLDLLLVKSRSRILSSSWLIAHLLQVLPRYYTFRPNMFKFNSLLSSEEPSVLTKLNSYNYLCNVYLFIILSFLKFCSTVFCVTLLFVTSLCYTSNITIVYLLKKLTYILTHIRRWWCWEWHCFFIFIHLFLS